MEIRPLIFLIPVIILAACGGQPPAQPTTTQTTAPSPSPTVTAPTVKGTTVPTAIPSVPSGTLVTTDSVIPTLTPVVVPSPSPQRATPVPTPLPGPTPIPSGPSSTTVPMATLPPTPDASCDSSEDVQVGIERIPFQHLLSIMPQVMLVIMQGDFQGACELLDRLLAEAGVGPASSTDGPMATPVPTPLVPATPSPSPTPGPTATPQAPPVPQPSSRVFGDSRPDDTWPQAFESPDFSRISLSWLENGFTEVRGDFGAIPGGFPVYVVSPNTASAALTQSSPDGSFTTQVAAPPGSWVIVKYDPLGGRWLSTDVLQDPRPTSVNASPGSMAQVPFEPSSISGVPFIMSGTTLPSHIDFTLDGSMTGVFRPGGSVTVSGTATVYVAAGSLDATSGQRLNLNVILVPLFDSQGNARMMANQFFSNILTPTGLPVEHWLGPTLKQAGLQTGTLSPDGSENGLTAPFSFNMPIPPDAASGTYSLWLDTFDFSFAEGSLGGDRPEVNPFMANHALAFPPFEVGAPAQPKLIWTLLTDVISADGSRGTSAVEDGDNFQIANRIATQSHSFIIPQRSRETGQAITYRLEPYLPMVAHGDRYIPNVPNFTFDFPSGSLLVDITRPDGLQETLGPAPFTSANTRTPATSQGALLDNGGGHLAEVFQLATGSGLFDYQFPDYGEYEIQMTGTVEDIYGNSFEGGGTYRVFVAQPLDIEPAVLPMTPLEVGDYLNSGVTLLPGVPATVEVKATLLVESDPGQSVEYVVSGAANRFGTFTAPLDSPRIEMTGPGELLVETTATYTDEAGVLWMAATRWGQVVASPDTTLLAHGRRGRDDTPSSEVKLWFNSAFTGSTAHVNLPYATGDILWQSGDDAARAIITVQDTEGQVEEAILAWNLQGNYNTVGEGVMDDRVRLDELPLAFATANSYNAALVPEEIVSYGYWYAGVQRPGERVREIISDDDVGTAYWRFGETYGLQPGMGIEGDMPNDFKFQFGGAVFRDTTRDLNRYGIYASLWVHLPDDDPIGSRVFPPFQGANGGPSGGPIMTLAGEEIDAFVVPLGVRPGTILEAGDTFSFSAHLAPTLPAQLDVIVTGPGGFSQEISGRANSIGYFYDPGQDFEVATAGVYHVAVTATFDAPTSAGPISPPYPTGTVLGAVESGFDIYVVPQNGPALGTSHPEWSVVRGVVDVPILVEAPDGFSSGTIHYTIAMPGFLLESGEAPLTDGYGMLNYDPVELNLTFPNIDVRHSRVYKDQSNLGLVDTVWINAMLEADDGQFYARQFTLQGPDLYAVDGG